MKKAIHVLVLIAALIIMQSANIFAGPLRGRIISRDGRPASNTRVELCIWNAALNQWVSVAFALSGNDGFYYFMNVQPGQRVLIRIRGQYYPSLTGPLLVQNLPGNAYQDIAPVVSN